jgi:hypothetical protein
MTGPPGSPHRRGTSNTNARGSAESRRARRAWIMATYGVDGIVVCWRCDLPMFEHEFEVDRVIAGALGGTYARSNIRPACSPCNIDHGNLVRDGLA